MTLERKSVLEPIKIEKNGILVEEVPFVKKLNLRGNPQDKDFLSTLGSIFEILIPLDPNTKVQNDKVQIIWLSPTEWLVNFFNDKNYNTILEDLKSRLNVQKTSITDISENKTILRLEGSNVLSLLKKFMILDIENVLVSSSKVAQTIFVKIPILIIKNSKDSSYKSFDIHLNRSHAQYVRDLLIDGNNNLDY
tara:strand:+ start:467 stop:1045 length:579 start_codon:yes stop_codon:yes gene_type:complete